MNLLYKMSLVLVLMIGSTLCAEEKQTKENEIAIEIRITCPMSEEFKNFINSVPPPENQTTSLEEWKRSFSRSMSELLRLVESGKVSQASWTCKTDCTEENVAQEN